MASDSKVYFKAYKVLVSCETKEQRDNAIKYCKLALRALDPSKGYRGLLRYRMNWVATQFD